MKAKNNDNNNNLKSSLVIKKQSLCYLAILNSLFTTNIKLHFQNSSFTNHNLAFHSKPVTGGLLLLVRPFTALCLACRSRLLFFGFALRPLSGHSRLLNHQRPLIGNVFETPALSIYIFNFFHSVLGVVHRNADRVSGINFACNM